MIRTVFTGAAAAILFATAALPADALPPQGGVAVAGAVAGGAAAAQPAPAATPQAAPAGRVSRETLIDRQTREISSQLRCVVCQGVSLQDSPSQLAQEMRAIVREKLEEGMAPAEVRAYFVDRYGEWVLLQPEPKGFNLVVYLLPVAMLFGGAGFVFMKARSWTRRPEGAAETEEAEEEEALY